MLCTHFRHAGETWTHCVSWDMMGTCCRHVGTHCDHFLIIYELNNLKLKINEDEKVHHSMYLLHALIPFLKHFNQEQLMEKEIEAKIQGLSLAALELQKAACEKDERVYWRSVMVTCREVGRK
ncbi:unnamed protein product [Camellia sinensis]